MIIRSINKLISIYTSHSFDDFLLVKGFLTSNQFISASFLCHPEEDHHRGLRTMPAEDSCKLTSEAPYLTLPSSSLFRMSSFPTLLYFLPSWHSPKCARFHTSRQSCWRSISFITYFSGNWRSLIDFVANQKYWATFWGIFQGKLHPHAFYFHDRLQARGVIYQTD